jgi:hypothetical protein
MGIQWRSVISESFKTNQVIKKSVCGNNSSNPDELKTSMSNITARISPATLQAVSTDMFRRARLCTQHASAHFQKVL